LIVLVSGFSIGGPGSNVGFDFPRTDLARHRLGTATGVVIMGGFIGSLTAILLIGVVLDLLRPDGHYDLEAFRLAFAVQLPMLAIGVAGMLITRRTLRASAAARRRRDGTLRGRSARRGLRPRSVPSRLRRAAADARDRGGRDADHPSHPAPAHGGPRRRGAALARRVAFGSLAPPLARARPSPALAAATSPDVAFPPTVTFKEEICRSRWGSSGSASSAPTSRSSSPPTPRSRRSTPSTPCPSGSTRSRSGASASPAATRPSRTCSPPKSTPSRSSPSAGPTASTPWPRCAPES